MGPYGRGRILPKSHCSRLFLRLEIFMTRYEPALDPLVSESNQVMRTRVRGFVMIPYFKKHNRDIEQVSIVPN
jgi:hypothetical protein